MIFFIRFIFGIKEKNIYVQNSDITNDVVIRFTNLKIGLLN